MRQLIESARGVALLTACLGLGLSLAGCNSEQATPPTAPGAMEPSKGAMESGKMEPSKGAMESDKMEPAKGAMESGKMDSGKMESGKMDSGKMAPETPK